MIRRPPRSTLFPLHDALPISDLIGSRDPPTSRASPRRAIAGRRETARADVRDRKSTRLNSSHSQISYAVFCLKKKKKTIAKDSWSSSPPRSRGHATRELEIVP